MKKLNEVFKNGKKRATAAVLLGALVVAAGGTSVFAATGGFDKIMGRMTENGLQSSSDNGETWTDGVPADVNFSAEEDGITSFSTGNGESVELPDSDTAPVTDDSSVIAKSEDGNVQYSTDNGKSWSDQIPEGYQVN